MTNWRKTYYPCTVCDKKAVGCYRPDLDMQGLCFCEEHKEQVQFAYVALISGDKKLAKELLSKKDHE